MSSNYQINDRIEVTIEKIVPGGFGLGFAPKLTVFVQLTAPGDRLLVSITRLKKRIAFAEIVEILKSSPLRIKPPCPYFGQCGGCDFQQMNYQAQLDAKVAIIKDNLKRIAKINQLETIEIEGSPNELNYRSRAQWHADPDSRNFGYFRRSSHKVIDVESCPILTPALDVVLKEIRRNIAWENVWDDRVEFEAAASDDGASINTSVPTEPPAIISYSTKDDTYYYSAETFFQGNHYLIEPLIEAAIGGTGGDTVVDLYCGVGLFSLPLARNFRAVLGVEGDEKAVEFAKLNAERAGIKNIDFRNGDVDRMLRNGEFERPDLLFLDPPRAGADIESIKAIGRLGANEISYVSCDPSILARDLRILIDSDYEIAAMKAFDLFPQTHHVETVVRLKRL